MESVQKEMVSTHVLHYRLIILGNEQCDAQNQLDKNKIFKEPHKYSQRRQSDFSPEES